ncbi:MAG: lipopolysaccharide kinase InaA family protein [Planctomycetes bacterium]|nr:lipopolysaccharide kinase InaA family protein [Planctomycetota bacterium]
MKSSTPIVAPRSDERASSRVEAPWTHWDGLAALPAPTFPTAPPDGFGAREWFDALWNRRPRSFLRRVPGRETFFVPDDGAFVVKRSVGIDAREWWHERLHRGRVRAPATIEAENLAELAAAGFPVPRAIAAHVDARAFGVGVRSVLVMERVAHDADLGSALAEASSERRRAWLVELAELVARLHRAGFYHRDLYFQHVVLPRERRASSSFVLLDCGRVRRERAPRERWFVKDLAALAHSRPSAVGDREWREFVAHYVEARGASLGLEALLAAIESKRARLASHAPRHVDPDGGRPSRA